MKEVTNEKGSPVKNVTDENESLMKKVLMKRGLR